MFCTACNVESNGEQMGVHVPQSMDARTECKLVRMSSNNVLSPANGRPIAVPTQDIVLGCYYMTKNRKGVKGGGKVFSDEKEVIAAYNAE